jgi:hypothetical protein
MGNSLALDDRRDGPEDRRELGRENIGRRSTDLPRERRPKVECPACHTFDSDVIGGFWSQEDEVYIRPRKCRSCQNVFDTVEILRSQHKKFLQAQDIDES